MRGGILLTFLALAACDRLNMVSQRKYRTWDANGFLAQGRVEQGPAPGAIAKGDPGAPAPQPARIDMAMLARGQLMFTVACTPCHGRSGDGFGEIVSRGFPHPPPLYSASLRRAKGKLIYDTILHGHGAMYGYDDRVAPADAWAIVAYVRALQASAGIASAKLDDHDRAALGAGG